MNQVLLLAGLAVAALLISAPQALAISELSEEQCDQPSASDDDLWDSFANYDTSNWSEKGCKKFCSALRKVCLKNGKGRVRCVKDTDKLFFELSYALCEDPECAAAVKEEAKMCKDDLKEEATASKDDCNALQDECLLDCAEGMLNPQL